MLKIHGSLLKITIIKLTEINFSLILFGWKNIVSINLIFKFKVLFKKNLNEILY